STKKGLLRQSATGSAGVTNVTAPNRGRAAAPCDRWGTVSTIAGRSIPGPPYAPRAWLAVPSRSVRLRAGYRWPRSLATQRAQRGVPKRRVGAHKRYAPVEI